MKLNLTADEKSVIVPIGAYIEMLKDQRVLDALRAGGVDNWEWYDTALDEVDFSDLDDLEVVEGE